MPAMCNLLAKCAGLVHLHHEGAASARAAGDVQGHHGDSQDQQANQGRLADVRKSFTEGTLGALPPVCNTAAELRYVAVVSGPTAFIAFRESLQAIVGHQLLSVALAVSVLAGFSGSVSGGLSLALQAMGEY